MTTLPARPEDGPGSTPDTAASPTLTADLGDRLEPLPVAPTLEDPVVRGASEAFGGPLGRHALVGSSWWTPIRVLMLFAVLACGLMYAQKLPCRNAAWNNGFQYSHVCYTDIYPLYYTEGLDQGKRPYIDPHTDASGQQTYVEYPVLIGATMQITADLAKLHLTPSSNAAQRFLDVNWVVLTIAALVTVVATALTHRRRPWDAAMVALAPGLILAGLINWDLIAVAFTALALYAWARRHPVIAGLLLGLGIATKFYPIVLFAPLFLLCLRARRLRSFFAMLGGAAFTWAVVDVPVWLRSPQGFETFYRFNENRGPDWGSIWYAIEQITGSGYSTRQVNLMEALATVVVLAVVAAIALTAPRRPRLASLCFLTLALFLVVNKVYSPQYVLWLLPLAVLARPRWPSFLVWQFGEVLYFLAIWLYLLNVTRPGKGLEWQPYLVGLALRDLAVLFLCTLVVIDIFKPSRDVVRRDGADDPAGGVLDGAPDWLAPKQAAVPVG
ncbi:MAG: DUF2029 domain-containing protein [Acidothermus sp.]|nr:DUF2029 domain-containing protein [Acidothermus sp.]MCL6537389.1 glycosyltransferase 87 family protein [Acidothermus sp.]